MDRCLDKKGADMMTDSEHLTIREAARRYRVSDKKLQRVADLEDLVQRLLKRQEGSRPRQASPAKERTAGSLPRQFISLLVFAELHNVAAAKVLAHMDTGLLPVKRGKWTDKDGSVVTLALDPAGKRAFHQIYHGVPPFFECSQCPH